MPHWLSNQINSINPLIWIKTESKNKVQDSNKRKHTILIYQNEGEATVSHTPNSDNPRAFVVPAEVEETPGFDQTADAAETVGFG